VVLVDPEDRVLLIRWRFADGGGAWGVPGGGIEPGESHADAVRRELREEVGLDLSACGPCVGHRTHVFDIGGGYDGQEEWYYLARVETFTPRGELSDEELAAEGLVEVRWFTLEQMQAIPSDAPVSMYRGAVELTADLLAHGHPPTPYELDF
jgi:8-oxo-dGTP pyrophosphatase MutT (NUDIX family)